MKILFIFTLIFFHFNNLQAGNFSPETTKWYEQRGKFIKNYISIIKEKREENKKFGGSIVESLSGKWFFRYGPFPQGELDKRALNACKAAGELECLVRFRTLSKNPEYNRYAKYNSSKHRLKFRSKTIKSRKINSTKGIQVLISEEEFKNNNDFYCGKVTSNYRESLEYVRDAIRVYPISFLKNSSLKYVMVCEKLLFGNSESIALGLAPGHYDQSLGIFFLNLSALSRYKDIEKREKIVKKVFHHEYYHIIDASLSLIQLDEKWEEINLVPYAKKLVKGKKGIDTSVKGFISQYARSNPAEDKAEFFAYMITEHAKFIEVVTEDEILIKKLELMISRLKKISPEINRKFWARLKKNIPY